MKHRIITAAILSLAAVTACERTPEKPVYPPLDVQDMAFDATIESVLPLEFSAGDKISVFDGIDSRTFTTPQKGIMVSFEGQADANADGYVAVYPAARGQRFSGRVQMDIPTSQAGVLNSYDKSVKIATAVAKGKSLAFQNVLSFLKVQIDEPDYDVVSMSLVSNAGEPISGSVYVGLFEEPTVEPFTSGAQNQVNLNGSKLNGTFYIAVMPQTLSQGYTIALTNSQDGRFEKVVSDPATFERNSIYDLGKVGNVVWEDKPNPNPTRLPKNIILKASFRNADFNMVSEGGFEDYIDKPIFYRTAWIPINGADKNVSYEGGTPIEGNATLHFDASPVGGVWLDLNQFVAVPQNTDLQMSFTQSVNTPYSRNAFIGEGPREEWLREIQGHDMQLWDLSGYYAWNSTDTKSYTLEFNTMNYYWGILVFTIAGDPGRYEILDDVKLIPAGYTAKSIETDNVIKVGQIGNATYDEVSELGKILAWTNEDGGLSLALSDAVIRGTHVDNTVAAADENTLSLVKFNKESGKIKPALAAEGDRVTSIVPDDVFAYNGKSYMHYYAKTVQEDRDIWRSAYSGFLVSEDAGLTWQKPAHGRNWTAWVESEGNTQKAPYEWFSEASVCHADDGYFYMVHCAFGREWSNYSNYFVSRCPETADITDPESWQHWIGLEWSDSESDVNASAMITIGNRSEPCLVYNKAFNRFMLIYRSERHQGIVFRDAASVDGAWSGEKILTDDDIHGECFAPSAVRVEDDGSIIFVASQF